jgi:uncharacterized glyoxalase superfamily protein PhnB
VDSSKPVLGQLNIVARDFDRSLEFYRRLGVDVPDSPPFANGVRHAEVEMTDGFTLEFDSEPLASSYNARWRQPDTSSRVLIGFRVSARNDVDELYECMTAAGYEGAQPPYDTFWGARYAILVDPDGHDVGIMSPLDPTQRYWPPEDSPSP